jgi:hypothetical protein
MTDLEGTIDPLEDAQAELAGYRIMSPEDLLEQLSPNGCLYFLQQTAYECLKHWATELFPDTEQAEWEGTPVTSAFQTIVTVCGELDQACVFVGILPPEAAAVPDERPE